MKFKSFVVFIIIIFIRLGLNADLIHQNRSYRDSETKENVHVEAQKMKQRGETTGRGQRFVVYFILIPYYFPIFHDVWLLSPRKGHSAVTLIFIYFKFRIKTT